MAAFHDQFVQTLRGGAGAYAAAEAANASPLQGLDDLLSPVKALTGRPLFGDGASGASAGAAGKDGGWVFGNGGNGVAGAANTGQAGGNGGNAGLIRQRGYRRHGRQRHP